MIAELRSESHSLATGNSQLATRLRGFTLAEAMIASVVLAASVIGIATALGASYQQNAVRGNVTTALSLARQLMEEIASRPLEVPSYMTDKPGWSSGQTDRRQYDTIGDYHGYSDVSGSIRTADGTLIDMGDGGSYTRTVSVTASQPSGLTGPAADFVKVTVTVQMPQAQSIVLAQLFTRTTILR